MYVCMYVCMDVYLYVCQSVQGVCNIVDCVCNISSRSGYSWLVTYRVVAGWLPGGCRVVAGWLPGGCLSLRCVGDGGSWGS